MKNAFISILVILALFSSASADQFDCLRRLQGGVVRWDMDWQRDRTDHEVLYKIVNISESQPQKNLHEVALELVALGPSKISKRVSRIKMDYAAEMFCMRATPVAVETPRPAFKALPDPAKNVLVAKRFTPENLPYRVFREGNWIPARMPTGEKIATCITKNAVFSCSELDSMTMIKNQRMEQIAGRGELENPFIRFRSGGWVRGSTADLARVGTFAICPLFDRKFTCLEEEKNAYAPQLKRVEARIARKSKG